MKGAGIIIAGAGAALIGYALFSPFRVVMGFRKGVPFPVTVRRVGRLWNGDWAWMELKAADAFEGLRRSAYAAGLDLPLSAAFRSWQEQAAMKAKRLLFGGPPTADPGYSNHQEGTTVDIDIGVRDAMTNYRSSRVWHWLRENARSYGFVDDVYQPGNPKYEPWHWRYYGE
ncbi:MAG: hypothetical protein EPN91_08520 [Salinibacterium sp.]|nr:MAG: hypothetical protein EPN91_08520 [Salinibacterium sp.]